MDEAAASAEHVLADLNAAQREAVTAVEGPVLVLAGPGSGKTRVIAHRIAYLIQHEDIAPWRIVAVTFTNKAAREMRSRVVAHLGETAADVMLGTFHSICTRLLRIDGGRAGIERGFNIYDDDDQMALIKRASDEIGIDPKRFNPRTILSTISHAKSQLQTADAYALATRNYYEEVVARAYEAYERSLAVSNALDFDDLILRTVQLLQQDDDVRRKYQERFVHVLVDEFQDTNIAQYELARLFSAAHGNICVVGDPDQSIYSWRSADIRNILNFERDFPDARIVLLEQNYRSTQNILDAAHAVISGARERKEKALWTDRDGGEPIVVWEGFNEMEEAEFVAGEINALADSEGGPGFEDVAVMYRTNAQSRALEEAFVRARIPYRLVGGTRFYERREVRDVLAYLRLVNNPYDAVSFRRIVNVPGRGIGQKTIEDLEDWARSQNVPLYTAVQMLAGTSGEAGRPVGARQAKALAGFLALIDELIAVAGRERLSALLDATLEAAEYRRYLFAAGEDDGETRWENIDELRNVASEYDGLEPGHGLPAFLEDIALISDADTIDEQKDERVTLITLHSAKGLEFRAVFMIAMEEGVLPHVRSFDEPGQIEEERRLCYVGMTRAKERLYLLRAFRRQMMGSSQHHPPSRFLSDIPERLIDHRAAVRDEAAGRRDAWVDDRPLVPDEAAFSAGEKVRHPRFGEGIVVSCTVVNDDQELVVAFKGGAGLKKLMLSFAPVERA